MKTNHQIKTLYKLIICAMSLFFSMITCAQTSKVSLELQQKVYQQAIYYQDYQVAKNAVYTMIVLAPNRHGLKDTLADIYFKTQNYQQCIKVCNDVLKEHNNNLYIREIKAISLQKVQNIKEAIQEYEELYKQSNLLNHAYYLMTLQYQLKRYGECEELIQSLLKHKKIEIATTQVSTQLAHQPFQIVLIKATFLNMLGVIAMDMNNYKQALQYFEQAIKISPNFLLAQNNLQLTKSRLSQQNK